jgi:protein-arginine kinase activator protein McsA
MYKKSFKNVKELYKFMKDGDYTFSSIIIDRVLQNIEDEEEEIVVGVLFDEDEKVNYEITVEWHDMVETLEAHLDILEDYEDFERCSKVRDGIKKLLDE